MSRFGIVSVGIGNWHPKGIDRLRESLIKTKFDGDFISFTDKYPDNSPTHQEIPYAFKPYAFEYMRKAGYKQVMWMDSSVWAIENINFMFNSIEASGYLMEDSGHNVGTWSSDTCLNALGVNREDAFGIPMFIAGCFGLSFDTAIGNTFLDKWLSEVDLFKGSWNNNNLDVSKDKRVHGHRHDMTVASIIAKDMKLEYFKNNTFMSYYEWYQKYKTDPSFNTKMISLLLQGM